MNFIKCVAALGLSLALAACGGGGGSAGTPVSGNGAGTGTDTGTVTVDTAAMVLTVVDGVGVEITNHILSQTQAQFLKVVLKDVTGAAVPYTKVAVTLDSSAAVLVPVSGTQLTDETGVVLMRIAPASVNSSGTVRATAVSTVNATALTQTYDFQITAGTVSLSAVSVSPASVQKGQSVNVYVDVTVNGVSATSNSVAVNFNSACGTVTPASALVDSAGRASAVVQTTSTGSCTVDASVNGVNSLPAPFTVTAPPITGLQFVSATPNLIYQAGSAGVNTSVVTFKVIDSLAMGVQGVNVNASLTNTDGGINFCGSPSTGSSAADGTVSFSICAGTLPATVQVRAELADAPTVFTSSNLLTVQTGLPTQRFFDISASKLNFYAGGYFTSKFNGNTVTISVFAADRQGNPVPDGTKIIFVAEGGQINSSGQSSCLLTSGRCSVDLIGQDYRPMGSSAGDKRPGRVTVLAYADGEESFIDKPDATGNYNNRYDLDKGELFEDLGSPYLDKDESGIFVPAYTNLVTNTNEGESTYPMPSRSIGDAVCPDNSNKGLSAANTCNSVWDGYTKVRRQIVIVFSGGEIGQPGNYDAVTNPEGYDDTILTENRTQVVGTATNEKIVVQLADRNGNPLPADAALSVEVIKETTESKCVATLLNSEIGSSTEPTIHEATLKDCSKSDVIRFKATVSSDAGSRISVLDVPVPTAP
ncbi:MAG: hypothetical protein WBI05_05775 [Rhodoferax sp.]|uniref:hypothetical protein n=1 Tax=Rhodoferax sp. TaxID=50421 RepID=UPI003BB72789